MYAHLVFLFLLGALLLSLPLFLFSRFPLPVFIRGAAKRRKAQRRGAWLGGAVTKKGDLPSASSCCPQVSSSPLSVSPLSFSLSHLFSLVLPFLEISSLAPALRATVFYWLSVFPACSALRLFPAPSALGSLLPSSFAVAPALLSSLLRLLMGKKKNGRGRGTARKPGKERRGDSDGEQPEKSGRREKKEKASRGTPVCSSFSSQLEAYGLELELIVPDGNCLFRAFADQHCGKQERHGEYREKAVDYIEAHAEDFQCFLSEEEESFKKYVNRMRRLGTWGSQVELQALSQVYEVSLFVHVANGVDPAGPWHGGARAPRGNTCEKKKKGRSVEKKGGAKPNRRRGRGGDEEDGEERWTGETEDTPEGDEQDWSICKMENFSESHPCVQLAFHVNHEHYNSIRVRGQTPGKMLTLAQVRRVLNMKAERDRESGETEEETADETSPEPAEETVEEEEEATEKRECVERGTEEDLDEGEKSVQGEGGEFATRRMESDKVLGPTESARACQKEQEGEKDANVCPVVQPATEASGSCVGNLLESKAGESEESREHVEDAATQSGEGSVKNREETVEVTRVEAGQSEETEGIANQEEKCCDARRAEASVVEETAEQIPEGDLKKHGAREKRRTQQKDRGEQSTAEDRKTADRASKNGAFMEEGDAPSFAPDKHGQEDAGSQHTFSSSLASDGSSSSVSASSPSSLSATSSCCHCPPQSSSSSSSSVACCPSSPASFPVSRSSASASASVHPLARNVSASPRWSAGPRRSRSTGALIRGSGEVEREAGFCSPSRACCLVSSSRNASISDSPASSAEAFSAPAHADAFSVHGGLPASGSPSRESSSSEDGASCCLHSHRLSECGGDHRRPCASLHAELRNEEKDGFQNRRVKRRNSLRVCSGTSSWSPSRPLLSGRSSRMCATCAFRMQPLPSSLKQNSCPSPLSESSSLPSSVLSCASRSASAVASSPSALVPSSRCSSEALPNGDEETGEEKDEREARPSPLVCV
ncbi:UNVERIFIED_CONTAM: OTU family cysteine protease [Hammondia hammondi]|eukprot:XP_008889548.1 OTU family cysteine protease [Hammondia hammondi]